MTQMIGRGLAAGAAGTTALNAVTYLDMALRGRPASELPEQAVADLARRTGRDVPGHGDLRRNRLQGLGALGGIIVGTCVGAAAAIVAPMARRLPTAVTGPLLGAAAMASTDLPMMRSGLTDPKTWSSSDWLADVLPHLAYGTVTAWTLRALERRTS
jgi:hypothetical protein